MVQSCSTWSEARGDGIFTINLSDIRPDDDTTLLQMLEYNLSDHIHRLEEVAGSAMKEFALERSLEKMKEEWADMAFTLLPYRDTVKAITKISFVPKKFRT